MTQRLSVCVPDGVKKVLLKIAKNDEFRGKLSNVLYKAIMEYLLPQSGTQPYKIEQNSEAQNGGEEGLFGAEE